MTTLPKFEETEITVEDEVITIVQHRDYSANTVKIPVSFWFKFAKTIDSEIERSTIHNQTDLAEEAFNMLNAMNHAKSEGLK